MRKAPPHACYFVVADIEEHFKRAKEAGAAIELEIKDYEHGGRRYSCRDLEGHVWTFGTYDPWKGKTASTDAAAKDAADKKPLANDRAPVAVARPACRRCKAGSAPRGVIAAGALTLAAIGVTAWQLQSDSKASLDAATSEAAAKEAELRRTESEFAVAQQELAKTREELAQERTAREVVELRSAPCRPSSRPSAAAASRPSARRGAQGGRARPDGQDNRGAGTGAQRLAEEHKARESVEAAQREATALLEKERSARQEAERAVTTVKAELATAQSARTAAEKTTSALDEQMKRDKLAAQTTSAAKAPETRLLRRRSPRRRRRQAGSSPRPRAPSRTSRWRRSPSLPLRWQPRSSAPTPSPTIPSSPPARPRSPRATSRRRAATSRSSPTPASPKGRWRWAAPTTEEVPSVPVLRGRKPTVHAPRSGTGGPSSLPKQRGRRQSDSIGGIARSRAGEGTRTQLYQQIKRRSALAPLSARCAAVVLAGLAGGCSCDEMIDPWAPVSITRAEAGESGVAPPACDVEAGEATSKSALGAADPDLLEIARLEVERDCYKDAEQSLRARVNKLETTRASLK